MPIIRFKTSISQVGTWAILRLPESASKELPSRGATLIKGTLNGIPILAVLEPDGKGSHWFRVDHSLMEAAAVGKSDMVELLIEPSKEWPEPTVPTDFENALFSTQTVHDRWTKITPMAQWEWIRWIRSTKNSETRKRRIEAACDKLLKGERRPCCFNRNLCTEPEISHNGILIDDS